MLKSWSVTCRRTGSTPDHAHHLLGGLQIVCVHSVGKFPTCCSRMKGAEKQEPCKCTILADHLLLVPDTALYRLYTVAQCPSLARTATCQAGCQVGYVANSILSIKNLMKQHKYILDIHGSAEAT